jgi:dihydrofolate reductase
MGKLIYLLNVSLDGFIETKDRSLAWTTVDDELHTWFNDHARTISASLYGRRLYEVMSAYWPTYESDPDATEPMREFGRIWNATPRFVFSSTLERVEFNSRLVRGDVGEALARVRTEFDGDLEVGGPTLAASFVRRGLVDEYHLVVHPVILGGGRPFFPELESPIPLRLAETRRFASGAVYLGYATDRS